MSFKYAQEQGAKYLLVTEKGDIKAFARTEAVLLYSRQRKQGDIVMTLGQFRKTHPYAY